MSKIRLKDIEAYSGDSITLVNTVNFQSVPTGTTTDGLAIDSNGRLIRSRGGNISDAFYEVNYNAMAEGTTSATTSYLVYGVNVFNNSGVTVTNYATKLPQPVTGKSVKVTNNGNTYLYVYPSNLNGKINGVVNKPIILPPDGKVYNFICILNPTPGSWTVSPPATNQYDSGEITVSLKAGSASGFNPIASAVNPSYVVSGESFTSSTAWSYNGYNKPTIILDNANKVYAFIPNIPWAGVTKIKVYTNLINTNADKTIIYLQGSNQNNYYSLNDFSFLSNGSGGATSITTLTTNNLISGTATTGSTIYTSATNIGGEGTVWGEKVISPYGDSFNNRTVIGTEEFNSPTPYPYGSKYDGSGNLINTGDDVLNINSTYVSFQIKPFGNTFNYGTIPDVKFRFYIEYFQY